MKVIFGITLCTVFLFVSGLHIYWGVGGKWAKDAAVPTKANNEKKIMNPGLFQCLVVAFGLLGFAVISLMKSGIIFFKMPGSLLNYGIWVIAAIFLLRAIGEFKYVGFFKKVTATKFAKMDTKYYSPLCLFIAISAIILGLIA